MVMQGVRKNQGEDASAMCFPGHAGIESCRLIAESINKPSHHKSRERLLIKHLPHPLPSPGEKGKGVKTD